MNIWEQLVDCIVRPPRDEYTLEQLLGGPEGRFSLQGVEVVRRDFVVINARIQKLQCSHYIPLHVRGKDGRLPCVVYCHCNSGSRRDAEEAVWHLLPCGISVVAFDFSGSGKSDGDWVSLGANEADDLEAVVRHLRLEDSVSAVGLWGRSMGAVTALMYSSRDPAVAGMVLDSPFRRLTDLMVDIVEQQRLPIPKVMMRLALSLMRKSVRRKAVFDINSVAPIDIVPSSTIPAVFGHGMNDTFIPITHSESLQAAYGGEYRNLVRFEGDHNQPRPDFFYDGVCCFFHNVLQLDSQLLGGNPVAARALRGAAPRAAGGGRRSAGAGARGDEHVQGHDEARSNGAVNEPWHLGSLGAGSGAEAVAPGEALAALAAREERATSGGGDERAQRGWPVGGGVDDDDDPDLMMAIAESLVGTRLGGSGGDEAGAAGDAQAAQQQARQPQPARAASGARAPTAPGALRPPSTLEEEEQMLQRALEESMALAGAASPSPPPPAPPPPAALPAASVSTDGAKGAVNSSWALPKSEAPAAAPRTSLCPDLLDQLTRLGPDAAGINSPAPAPSILRAALPPPLLSLSSPADPAQPSTAPAAAAPHPAAQAAPPPRAPASPPYAWPPPPALGLAPGHLEQLALPPATATKPPSRAERVPPAEVAIPPAVCIPALKQQ